jgi:hypothetical protein
MKAAAKATVVIGLSVRRSDLFERQLRSSMHPRRHEQRQLGHAKAVTVQVAG